MRNGCIKTNPNFNINPICVRQQMGTTFVVQNSLRNVGTCMHATSVTQTRNLSWWRHQMETFSALLAICAGNSPVNSPHKGQWRWALMFSLICTRINGWVNNGEAGDLIRHRAHYDVTVMFRTMADEDQDLEVMHNDEFSIFIKSLYKSMQDIHMLLWNQTLEFYTQ